MKQFIAYICIGIICWSASRAQQEFSDFQIFKNDTINQVYETNEFVPLMDMKKAQLDLAQMSRNYDELIQTVGELDKRKSSLTRHTSNARLSATLTLQDMQKTQDLLSQRRTQVALSLNKVRSLQVSLDDLSKDLTQAKKQISTYSKFLWKTLNDYYVSAEELSEIKLLSKSDSVAHSLSKQDLSELLYTNLEQLFAKMNDISSSYELTLHKLQAHIAGYHEEIALYERDLQTLEQQREHVQQILGFLEKDQKFLDQQLDRFTRSQSELEHQMMRMDKITTETESFLSENEQVRSLLEEQDRASGTDYFSWPIRVPAGVDDEITSIQYADASGKVLKTKQSQEIYAPAPGIVYKVFADAEVSLNRVILLHKHGYSSVILPLSQVFVAPGDVVRRGQVIGLSGGAPGTPGAGIESMGAHTYFEILKNSEAIDPYLVMDLSVFQSADDLDEQYHLKWKQNYLARTIDLSDLPKLKGETVQERRDYFLSKSGNAVFGDPGLRLAAADGTGIDPIFGICIGAAETSYRNFKSGNNIGNVGNDDSGNTIVYDSPVAGVAAIYKTLSNKYLGQYSTMDQLSRYGNDNGYIYASSSLNRQKNIMRCLSMIYEVNVPEDYFFRVSSK